MFCAVSAMHGRHALSRLWAAHTASLGFDAVYVCCTTGDEDNYRTCSGYFRQSANCANEPLAGKFNEAMLWAMKEGATRIMILPSDDFISPAYFAAAKESTLDYIVPHTCGIYDLQSGQAFAIKKLNLTPGSTLKFGAGRVVSRSAVEACGGQLWPSELNRGLDSASHARLFLHGIRHTVIDTPGIPITDVKTMAPNNEGKLESNNLWPFRTWENGSAIITEDDALHMLAPDLKAELLALRA